MNLCWLVPGVVGGSEESTTDSLRALLESGEQNLEIEAAVLAPFLNAHRDLADAIKCHVAPMGEQNKALRILVEQSWLAALARRRRVDLVHHAGGVVPLVHPTRTVLTIHDLQPLEHPENFALVKRRYLDAMIGRSARSADVICVPSLFTAGRVQEILGIGPERIVHVPWPLPQRRTPAGVPEGAGAGVTASDDESLYDGWTPDSRFVLYPSITYPHKRHLLLVEAFALVAASDPRLDLVLTGGEAQMEQAVRDSLESLGLADRVKRLGRVPARRLEALYSHAALVAIPSSYEGFGLPALESMTMGAPVVAARVASLAELLPEAWTVEGDDPADWAVAIAQVVAFGPEERAVRVAEGRHLASQFTPERTADALASAYRLALNPHPRNA